jgi:hypothetical protein
MPAAYEVEARHASIKFQTVLLDILVFYLNFLFFNNFFQLSKEKSKRNSFERKLVSQR